MGRNSGAWTCTRCSASKRRRNEPDELHIIPYLCCYELKLNWPSSGAAVRRNLGAVFVTMCLSALLNHHSLLIWMSHLGKEMAFWKIFLFRVLLFTTYYDFFSASLNWGKSCSELLLHLMENKHRWKTTALRLPQPSDLTWALIFHLFCFFPTGQFYSKFMSSCWKTAEHFLSPKILWKLESNALDPNLNLACWPHVAPSGTISCQQERCNSSSLSG